VEKVEELSGIEKTLTERLPEPEEVERNQVVGVRFVSSEERKKMLNSWRQAMSHRLDWLWSIGDKFLKWKFKVQAFLLILVILLAGVIITLMLADVTG
jgi:hypothetical protein